MKKRPYRATSVNDVDEQVLASELESQDVTVGVDVAKEDFVAALMNEDGLVVKTIKWKHPAESRTFIGLLSELKHKASVTLQVALEPSGTYGIALQHLLLSAEVPVFQVSPKHVHDMMEIYDGVPSSHDGKSAAVIATLHQDRRSRPWKPHSDQMRELRARIKQMDLQREHFQRMVNQLEALLAMYWPELPHLLDLDSVTLLALLAKFGSPQEVARRSVEADELMQHKGRARLTAKKKAAVLESARTTTGVVPIEVEVEALQWLVGEMQRAASMLKEAQDAVKALSEREPMNHLSEVAGQVTSAVLVAVVGDPRDFASASHFFNLPEDLVMVRKIKPQRSQRAQRVVIFIFRPLCVTLCPLWFSETLFRKYQKSSGFWSLQREIPKTRIDCRCLSFVHWSKITRVSNGGARCPPVFISDRESC